jgi:putative iron-regulated protein
VVLVAFGGVLAGCGGDDEAASVPAERKAAVAERYADLVYAAYGASVAGAEQLRERIDGFLARPTQARLRGARNAWIDARDDYIVTEPFRFYGGPIDDPKTGPEGLINAWPMDEAYVDYVAGDAGTGIINDRRRHPTITKAVIVAANERDGETNISSGWHAIEFLLWGQDRSKSGPGNRPVSDYTTAPNARRRATYLRLTTERLLSDLSAVRARWKPGDGSYRAQFLADPSDALTKILRGVGTLNSLELAGERIAVALESKDQEDEHSCFSDNTNADVVNDIRGIRMVYSGRFGKIAGPSVEGLIREADPALAQSIGRQIAATLAKAKAFPATFETMIAAPAGSAENEAVADVITGLEAQGRDLARAAEALGVTVNFES